MWEGWSKALPTGASPASLGAAPTPARLSRSSRSSEGAEALTGRSLSLSKKAVIAASTDILPQRWVPAAVLVKHWWLSCFPPRLACRCHADQAQTPWTWLASGGPDKVWGAASNPRQHRNRGVNTQKSDLLPEIEAHAEWRA